ncbi:MAG: YidC/Oxa1 family membrane protein insertase [Candidatus Andersenbacteria bacterium]
MLQTIFVDPFLNLLIFLRNILPGTDLGIAIILLTLIVRLILYPFAARQIKAQRAMQDLQPRINEIREKHKADKEAQTKALMEFYKKNRVNPLSSCLPLVVQILFIYPLFIVFRTTISGVDFTSRLYPFIAHPTLPMDLHFLNFLDLSATHNIYLAVITAAAQFYQSWMLTRRRKKQQQGKPAANDPSAAAQSLTNNLTYIFPLLTGYFAYQFPAGLALYWLASTLFAILQQWIIMRTPASRPKPDHSETEVAVVK